MKTCINFYVVRKSFIEPMLIRTTLHIRMDIEKKTPENKAVTVTLQCSAETMGTVILCQNDDRINKCGRKMVDSGEP